MSIQHLIYLKILTIPWYSWCSSKGGMRSSKWCICPWLSNLAPRHLPTWNRNICPHEGLGMKVHSTFIDIGNNQELETTQHPSPGVWTNTRGIAIWWSTNTAIQKPQTTDKHNIRGESRNHYIEWKRPDPKYFILYTIHFKIQIPFEILEKANESIVT